MELWREQTFYDDVCDALVPERSTELFSTSYQSCVARTGICGHDMGHYQHDAAKQVHYSHTLPFGRVHQSSLPAQHCFSTTRNVHRHLLARNNSVNQTGSCSSNEREGPRKERSISLRISQVRVGSHVPQGVQPGKAEWGVPFSSAGLLNNWVIKFSLPLPKTCPNLPS